MKKFAFALVAVLTVAGVSQAQCFGGHCGAATNVRFAQAGYGHARFVTPFVATTQVVTPVTVIAPSVAAAVTVDPNAVATTTAFAVPLTTTTFVSPYTSAFFAPTVIRHRAFVDYGGVRMIRRR